MNRRTLLLAAGLALAGCSAVQKIPPRPAELRVLADPPSASVQVNEHFVGAARVLEKQPASMAPGKKRITIEAPGYFPHDMELDLPVGVTTVNIKLRPVPP